MFALILKDRHKMSISALSALISSVALIGVAVSLYLQSRQLRSAQLQSAAASQIELLKFAVDHPAVVAELEGSSDAETFVKQVALNWYISHLSIGYANKTVSRKRLHSISGLLFSTESGRNWWSSVGQGYSDAATSRREKEFFGIVNEEYEQSVRASRSPAARPDPPERPPDPSAPSSR